MKNQFYLKSAATALFGLYAVFTGEAFASASFSSQSVVNFSIEDVVGISSDLSSLAMSGSFMRSGDEFPVTWTQTTGDATVVDDNPELEPAITTVAIGGTYSHSFSLSGQASDGMIDYNQVGWYKLGFVNNGPDSFDITLKFSYQLSSDVLGAAVGGNSVLIGYEDDSGVYQGYDYIEAMAQAPELSNAAAVNGGPFTFTFTLDASNPSKDFYVNVNHVGYLEASPVPVPAAVWPFLTGLLGMVGMSKRKLLLAQSI